VHFLKGCQHHPSRHQPAQSQQNNVRAKAKLYFADFEHVFAYWDISTHPNCGTKKIGSVDI